MKTKNEVYVEVRTEKQASKLKKVLNMFKERIYRGTELGLETGKDSDGDIQFDYPYIGFDTDGEWCGFRNVSKGEVTKVSIKQLRNILAAEHLKEGDVCVFKDLGGEYTDIYERMAPNFKGQFEAKEGIYKNFIRYATEEEKALLEPKKELEVGKWYISVSDNIIYYGGDSNSYGIFRSADKWITSINEMFESTDAFKDAFNKGLWKEATPEEVEKALIEEAKRRGLVKGVKIKSDWCSGGVSYGALGDRYYYSISMSELVSSGSGAYTLFKDGKWAEVIKHESPEQKVVKYAESVDWDFEKVCENLRFVTGSCITYKEWDGLEGHDSDDKVLNIFNKYNPHWELKKAHKEGAEIEVYCGGNWYDCDPMWLNNCEYRIKPLYAGDWVMYYSGDIKKYTIITESNLGHFSKRECIRVKNAKSIELLNNNK